MARFCAGGRTRHTTAGEVLIPTGSRGTGSLFAAGDVRAGSIKRVASAVGEGSIAVSFVHQALSE